MNEEEILKILSSYDLTEDEIEYLYLQLYFINELNNKTDEQMQEFHRIQKENRDSILSEIAKIMLTYTIIDTIMSISDSDKLKLQFRLNELVNKKVQSELDSEYLKTKETLRLVGEHKYYTNSYVNDLGGVKSDKDLKVDYLDKIINAKVDEKLWSDRLWDNKNQTAADLRKEIKKFLNGETTVNQIEDVIKKKYNTNAYETKRLVHTEIARVQEEINQIWAKDHGVKYQMFMATLDYKTSERCRGLDGKVFEFDDVNKPIPPLHPFCRSTLVDIPDKKWRPSERLDNITKERIEWQSYEEWYKNYIENNPVRLSEEKKYKNRFSDKEKYEKYKEILRKEVPESFDKFQELKYNNTNKYKELEIKYNDSLVKDLLKEHGIELVDKISDKLYSVKNYRPDIKEMTQHAKDNLESKSDRSSMTADKAKEFIDNAKLVIFDSQRKTMKFIAEDGYSVLNFDNVLVTAVPQKWRNKYNKYLKEE
ncbi:SPP1 gp7 family phage head morphogenesis protein [Clostridium butyricum 60E.3]|uniref:minor capsid protein n=1 Tax=Clostridium butyricum TaxID=1492 RepID=UPI0002D1799D|nr:minor capsid protein [Clostridium butyricum]ENZ33302.1 SPP1 gp7 family phage head morphogenesis protein [Clostridium butyricum 60E.3]MDU1340532.1 minor capsid protein [Clostridium butyricum]DAJ73795.1 MAG TPA: minor capsid protein [Caudoviricetes sp.]